eukprot:TRINITY_DN1666_c0_g1_i9.p1 TRINITY_DN1666_c0_g1~~TRINITY_DN1666_c0_g1_i9.p1  ORF type:complete len:101 (-),score=8.21 TRINITY_DN1666_c0_g1_i9:186-458(-)
MIRRPPRSTHCISSAASDVYKRQYSYFEYFVTRLLSLPLRRLLYYREREKRKGVLKQPNLLKGWKVLSWERRNTWRLVWIFIIDIILACT